MLATTKDNNTTKIKCGFLGNYFLSSADLHTLPLEMLKIAIKSFQSSFYLSKVLYYLRDFESMHFKLKSPYKAKNIP